MSARGIRSRDHRLAILLLMAVTAAWGSTFFLIRDLLVTVPVLDFLALRFTLAALAMYAVFHRQVHRLTRAEWQVGLVLGLLYGVAQVLQTYGLAHTSASVSGFITGSYVVLTPILGALVLKDLLGRVTWFAVALTAVGLAVLSLRGFAVGTGEGLTFLSAILYASHILVLGRRSTPAAAVGLATVQAGVIAVVTSALALPNGITLPHGAGPWASLIYMAAVAGAFALWAQTWAQAHMSATQAALVMALEPVFAAVFAVLFGGEYLTTRMLLGGILVVVAAYLVELDVPPEQGEALASDEPPAPALHHEP